jgi:division protein CdvB (Snf7/Vps24/ESCRT-III family)
MGGILPAAENELCEIGDMLSGVMLEAGQGSGMSLNFNSVSEDASKILSEAAIVAEQKIGASFPDLPPGMPTGNATDKTQT